MSNIKHLLSRNINGRVLAILVSFMHIITVVLPSPTPEDWSSGQFGFADDSNGDMFATAFINVTYFNQNEWVWEREEVGRYGGGYVGPAHGIVVHVTADDNPNDHTGCHLPFRSTRKDRRLPDPGESWIALIKRGKCNFEVKVENAFRSNAAGVLVYNDRDSDSLDRMKLSTDNGRKYLYKLFDLFF